MHKKKATLVLMTLILVFFFFAACLFEGLSPGSTISIFGHLTEKNTLLPINGARIRAGEKEVLSDTNGYFHLQSPYSFDLNVIISAPGYKTIEVPLFMPPRGGTIQLNKAMEATNSLGQIEGRVDLDYNPLPSFKNDKQNLTIEQAPRWNPQTTSVFTQETQEILVRFTPTMTSQGIKTTSQEHNLQSLGRLEGTDIFRLTSTSPQNLEEVLTRLRAEHNVELAEPNYIITSQGTFNDPYYSHQWGLEAIRMEGAWQASEGSREVVVAILDTGILQDHPDLKDNIIPGYNFIDGNGDTTDTNPTFSHGTHVAGIIGALGNNKQGIVGVSPKVSLLPLRVMNAKGQGSYASLIESLYFAADLGVDIINMSLGGPAPSQLLHEALIYAKNKGVTLIAASGNDNGPVMYPAAYPEVIAVGSINSDFKRASYSNYGPELDLVAPGGESNLIVSTAGRYDSLRQKEIHNYQGAQGTSMAAPHVSGVAALLVSLGLRDPDLIKDILTSTATPINNFGFSNQYGWGLLNASAALQGELECPLIFIAREENDLLIIEGQASYANSDGRYYLNDLPSGEYHVYGWLDSNKDGLVSAGDLFGKTTKKISIKADNVLYDIDFTMNTYLNPQEIIISQ